MGFDPAGLNVLLAAAMGLGLSFGIETLMRPRPALLRPLPAWGLHVGLWCLAFVLLSLILRRPWFAMAGVSAFFLMLVLVNQAKFRALREPFVFQDYEYFTDALRHPRLYIPFLGWGRFIAASVGFFVAVCIGLWGEAAHALYWSGTGFTGGLALVFLLAVACLGLAARHVPAVDFRPEADIRRLGFLASLYCYARASRRPVSQDSPFVRLNPADMGGELPHLVAIQSESFFDARSLYAGIRQEVLAEFDHLGQQALLRGELDVPAWGANTVRTEFAFLSGIGAQHLGAHRFNPYRAIASGWQPASLVSWLRGLGYRTVCIHPYPASFYQRQRVFPRLGFDAFLDIRAFDGMASAGPYIGDMAVAEQVAAVLQQAVGPVFVLAITMENHGPLHLESVARGELEALYARPPCPDCADLTIYLRHLRNADHMLASLHRSLSQCDRAASLCWFGDHVPIMPRVYDAFGFPSGRVPFLCWSSRTLGSGMAQDLAVEDLALAWLGALGMVTAAPRP
ncbi:MAG TPA: LTA synthase family protein [Thiobacillaceae bacterium]|nr:LTA synthase family protein [Thiobacillaceae bacterium]HNU65331.1 LTA synthase family protein [Thiobacillaceae bacterium]